LLSRNFVLPNGLSKWAAWGTGEGAWQQGSDLLSRISSRDEGART
jgi:hypothetical protein